MCIRDRYHGKEGESVGISLHEARNPAQEARYVAGSIRRMVREKGYRYRDIAVIASDMETYADPLEKACRTFDIPVFMDYKKSILQNAFVEYLRSLLGIDVYKRQYPDSTKAVLSGL